MNTSYRPAVRMARARAGTRKSHLAIARTLLAALAVCALGAHAAIVPTFNTGLPGPGATDPNYTHNFASGQAVGVSATTPFTLTSAGPWILNSASPLSTWVAPNAGAIVAPLSTVISYTTHFDMTGLDITTALFSGRWAAGDQGLDILLNGQSLPAVGGFFANAGPTGFSAFAFGSTGLQHNLNTLEFRVMNNRSDFGGLRVEYTGEARSLVPEPSSLALMGAALVGLAMSQRRSA